MAKYQIRNTYGIEAPAEARELLTKAFGRGQVPRSALQRATRNDLEFDATILMAQELGLTVVDFDGRPLIVQK